jgi:hypothetical protein
MDMSLRGASLDPKTIGAEGRKPVSWPLPEVCIAVTAFQ